MISKSLKTPALSLPVSIVHACRHSHKDTYANPAYTLPEKEWPHPPPPPSLLPALWSSWAESEVTWDGEGPPHLTHSHTAFYCDGTLNPITSIWQDCYSDIKGNLTGTWWMPLQSINSWLQWKLQRGRPLPSVHGVCGHPELHLTVNSEFFSLGLPGFEATGLADGVGRLNGRCSCCCHTCLHCREPPYSSSGTTLPKFPKPLLIITRSQTEWQHCC